MTFLVGLPLELEMDKFQIFNDYEISSLHNVFTRVQRTKTL